MTGRDHGDRSIPQEDAWDLSPQGAGALDAHEAHAHPAAHPGNGSLEDRSVGEPADLPPVALDEGASGDILPAEPLPDSVSDLSGDLSGEANVPTEALPAFPSEPPPISEVPDVPAEDPPPAFQLDASAAEAPATPADVWSPPEPSPVRARVRVRQPGILVSRNHVPQHYTGERHEDSLLFDMARLPARNTKSSAPPPAASGTTASGDDSGLIDITRLAETSAPARPSVRPPVDQLLTVAATPSLLPPPTANLLAPIKPPI